MTTRSNDVSVTLTGKDRLSPVIKNARQNMGRMQGGVVQMAGSLGALSSATTGVLGPLGGLVGSMGVLGLAVTGVGLGLSIGINKFKAWRAEQKKTSQAAESFRNKLMLSGFSADNATSSVDELRSSLGRLAFQALPGLDFEMQGFLVSMDAATRSRFAEYVQTLVNLGVPATQAMIAIGEAIQGNFGPISDLLRGKTGPITSFQDFAKALGTLSDQSAIAGSEVLQILREIGSGAISVEDGVSQLNQAANRDFGAFQETFDSNGTLIQELLKNLSESEFDYLTDQLATFKTANDSIVAYRGSYKLAIDDIIADLVKGRRVEDWYTKTLATEIEDRIKEIEKTHPALAAELRKAAREYEGNKLALGVLREVTRIEFDRINATQQGWVGSLEGDVQRAEGLYARLQAALVGARAQRSARLSLATPVPRPIPQFTPRQHGIIVTRPEIARIGEVPEIVAPLSRLPSLLEGLGGPRTIHIPVYIGNRLVRDLVVDVLNEEVSLREPSLGLG